MSVGDRCVSWVDTNCHNGRSHSSSFFFIRNCDDAREASKAFASRRLIEARFEYHLVAPGVQHRPLHDLNIDLIMLNYAHPVCAIDALGSTTTSKESELPEFPGEDP